MTLILSRAVRDSYHFRMHASELSSVTGLQSVFKRVLLVSLILYERWKVEVEVLGEILGGMKAVVVVGIGL